MSGEVTIPEDQRWVRCMGGVWFPNRELNDPHDWWPVARLVTAGEWDAICADRARLEDELVGLARLALHTTRRDVELFVHRLAYRHRRTPLGDALAEQDVVSAVSLRTVAAVEARLAKLDRIEAARSVHVRAVGDDDDTHEAAIEVRRAWLDLADALDGEP